MSELFAEFPPTTLDSWRDKVERDLKGASFDSLKSTLPSGIEVDPLYASSHDEKGETHQPVPEGDFARPLPLHGHPLVEEVGRRLKLDLAHGASGIWLRFDAATRSGAGTAAAKEQIGHDGVAVAGIDDLCKALHPVDPEQHEIHLDPGAAALPVAGLLLAWLQREKSQVDRDQVRGCLGADPLAVLAGFGELPGGVDAHFAQLRQLVQACDRELPSMRAIRVSTLAYHEAGGDAVDELTYGLATCAAYLRALIDPTDEPDGAAAPDAACRQFQLCFAVGGDLFLEIAKLRAARRLWARLAEAVGASAANRNIHLHAITSRRGRTTLDRGVNLLRGTVESFAATVAGADTISTMPYDQAVGLPSLFSRRLAINTQLMLREESQLHRVLDPAAGSGYVEKLTEQLASAAWRRMQEIEASGGMVQALTSGSVAQRLCESLQTRKAEVCTRRNPITGVSEFPNRIEEPLAKVPPSLEALRDSDWYGGCASSEPASADASSIDAGTVQSGSLETLASAALAGQRLSELVERMRAGTSGQETVTAPALQSWRSSEPFESLRLDAEALERRLGWRPPVSLLHLEDPRQHKARADFMRNLLAVGGLDTVEAPMAGATASDSQLDAFSDEALLAAFDETDTAVAVLCGTDASYPQRVPALARQLRAQGATRIVVAGKARSDEAQFREAGVTHFAHLGSDSCQLLAELLESFDTDSKGGAQ